MAAARQRAGHNGSGLGHGAAANGKLGPALRKCAYLVGLACAVFVTLLPVSLMLVGGTNCSAEQGQQGHDPPNWFQQANPFSHSNLCRVKRNIASMHMTSASSAPISHVGWHGDGHTAASPGSDASHGTDAAPPPSSELVTSTVQDHSPPPKQEAGPQLSAAEAQEQAWARQRAVNKQRQRRTAGDQYDEIELPEGDADVERILAFPHYDECNLCKVCVPLDVVKHHPQAQAHPAVRKVHLTQTLDEDVTVEVESMPPSSTAGGRGGKGLRQLSHWEPHALGAAATAAGGAAGSGGSEVAHEVRTVRWDAASNRTVVRRRGRQLHANKQDETESDSIYYIKGKRIDIFDIAPGDTKAGPRKMLPNCTVCWGCSHTLEMMASGSVMAGSYYSHEPGGSPSWLFRVRSNRTRSGWAVVKSWCVPVRKVKQRGLAMCSPTKVYAQVKLLLAQNKVIRECGLNSIIPALWVEPVRGVIPGHGFRIDWLGLWADVADGASVQNIHEFGKPRTPPPVLLDMLVKRVNHTEVQMVAVFDVLTSQCDRHQQNLFLTESGKLWAIDNDQVFGVAWRQCGVDSMLLPTTQKFMINHLGFFYVLKYPQKDPPRTWVDALNPLMLLDYRCHVEGGVLGTRFPGKLGQCLKHISSLSPPRIMVEYGYPSMRMAHALFNRSKDLHTKGFEWTLLYGEPTNQPQHRYKVPPACCNMTFNAKTNKYACTTRWKQMSEIPYGNPWHGGKWHGTPGKDTGSYEGGTVF